MKFIRVKSTCKPVRSLSKDKVKTKMKVWNQHMKDKNVVLHEIYTDLRDSDKKVPCSLKFKTDNPRSDRATES